MCAYQANKRSINGSIHEDPLQVTVDVQWEHNTIPHNNVSLGAFPHIDRHFLDTAGALGLVLHYLASTMCELSLQQIFSLIPTTVFHYLSFFLQILLIVLHKIPTAHIEWPYGKTFNHFTCHIVK